MSRYCVLRTCKEQAGQSVLKGEKSRSHKFPRDETLKAQWELFVNQANHTTNFKGTSHVVCSRHFDPSYYNEAGRLQRDAVPTIADRYTLKVAFKYNLLPKGYVTSDDLAHLNDFSNTVVQLRECEQNFDEEESQVPKPTAVEVHEVPVSRCCDHDDVLMGNDDDPLGEEFCSNAAGSNNQLLNGCDHRLGCNSEYCINPLDRSSESPAKRERRRYYPGDLRPSDFESPHQRVHNLNIIQRDLMETRYRLQRMQQKYKRAMEKIQKLQEDVSRLSKERVRSR